MKKILSSIIKILPRIFSIKTIIIIAIVAVIVGLIMYGLGLGIGKGVGDGVGDGNTKMVTSEEGINDVENDTIIEEEIEEVEEEITEEQNDANVDDYEGAIIYISVVESDYFYDNNRITLDDFITKVKEIESKLIVNIKDDNASRKSYDELIDRLKEEKIQYYEEEY